VLALASIGTLLFVHFLVQYILRGLRLRGQLIRLGKQARALSQRQPNQIKQDLESIFAGTRLATAWREFEETLHEQHVVTGGERRLSAIRATQAAEVFFNLDSIVDPWLGSEYFKHLPGILTGFGIIGTFFGLIQGLIHFDPNLVDPAAMKKSLGELFVYVRDAFMFSGSAIGLAILVTLVEKWLYSSCAKWVFNLSAALDGLFRAGVGEEYLSNLLRSSEDSATQVRQLKESMVDDLKPFLQNLTEQQIKATQQLSTDLGERIHESLKEPLTEIARTVKEASGRQHDAVGNVLEQLMTSFMTQMRETMGDQLGDLSGLMQQTAQAMSHVELAMKGLVTDMQKAGQDSTTSVQAAVRELMQQLSEHQRAQGEAVSSATSGVLAQLQQAIGRMAAAQEEITRRAREGDEVAAAELHRHVALVANASAETMSATRETLDRIGTVSTEMLDRLSAGAVSVAAAVSSVQQAAEGLARTASELASLEGQSRQSSQSMVQASAQLATASQSVANAVAQLGTASVSLEGVAKSVTLETDARSRLLQNMQEVIEKSQEASGQFSALAEEVRKTLESSFEQFGSGVGRVLSEHLTAYQKQLGDAVSMLRGALEELAEYALPDRK
jgi:hypothetical protein